MRGIRALTVSLLKGASSAGTATAATSLLGPRERRHDINNSSFAQREQQADTGFVARVVVDHNTRVVRLAGELDMTGRAEVTRACCEGTGIDVRVDLAELTFMDCGGYRGLAQARAVLEARGGSLTLVHAVGEPARLLGLLDVAVRPCRRRTLHRSMRDGAVSSPPRSRFP